MWDSGVHINCFYAWWETPEYRLNFPSEEIRQEFINNIDNKKDWIWDRLKWLRDDKQLELEQLYWYYKKYEGYIDKRLIKQEYPCSPKEAFLLSGDNAFDTEKLLARLETIKKPIRTGYFEYDYDGMRITNIKWKTDRNGYINIYQLPNSPAITKYCIGGDTAGEGSDFFTGHVLDAKTGIQVAVLKHKFDADQYAKQMYCLGKFYSYKDRERIEDALIGIEANFDSFPIRELQRLGYTNQYAREKFDEYTGKKEKRYGFKTTSLTRPTIISNLVQVVREHTETINDKDTLEELLTIIKNEKGRTEAPEGGHDDQMMGLAIAHEIRSQVAFIPDEIIVSPQYSFRAEKRYETNRDYGEELTVI
jgi:hypothetical protein